jgi:hypothetical protein
MITFTVRKLDPLTCEVCKDCVRKNTGMDFCQNFCRVNEEITYVCPFCFNNGTKMGLRSITTPLICSFCQRDLSRVEEMGRQAGIDLRIGYHRRLSIYA